MIIIADSGATKIDWCAISAEGKRTEVQSPGINLALMPQEAIEKVLEEAFRALELGDESVTNVHFYAAGLIPEPGREVPSSAERLNAILQRHFADAKKEYSSDLLGAARAVSGTKPGIAAILGTGSNSCLYDGEKIVKNVRSAGFILGDEGGGACLGKLFMADFLKGLLPESLAEEFAATFPVDYKTVVKNVYRGDSPSGYLGSFAPWIINHYESSEYVRNLVDYNFRNFIDRALSQYNLEAYPVGIVGGFAYANREILKKVAQEYGIKFSSIIKTPIEGLIEYHSPKV